MKIYFNNSGIAFIKTELKEMYAPGWVLYLFGFKRDSHCRGCLNPFGKDECLLCEDYNKTYVDNSPSVFGILLFPFKMLLFFVAIPAIALIVLLISAIVGVRFKI